MSSLSIHHAFPFFFAGSRWSWNKTWPAGLTAWGHDNCQNRTVKKLVNTQFFSKPPETQQCRYFITPRQQGISQLTWCTINALQHQDPRIELKLNRMAVWRLHSQHSCSLVLTRDVITEEQFRIAYFRTGFQLNLMFVWRVCVFLTVVECPTAKMLVYRPY